MYNKIAITLFVIFNLLIPIRLYAEEKDDLGVDVSITQDYVTSYIWRGQDLFPDNDGAYQPSIDVAFTEVFPGSVLALNVWGSFALTGGHEDADELDYTLTLSRDLSELWSMALGYTYFDYPNAGSQSDIQEPWISITLNKIPALPIDIYVNGFAGYDLEATSGGPDEGWYYSWGLGTDFPVANQAFSLSITNWGTDGAQDLEPSALYATDISVGTGYEFKGFNISPSINYTISHEDSINNDDELWGGIEVSYAL